MNVALRALFCAFAVLCLAVSTRAAQPELDSSVSTDRVEVGGSLRFQLSAMSAEGPAPTSPRLTIPNGFQFHGPSVSSQQRVSILNGRIERQQGLTATWTLVPSKPGRFTIGPPSVTVGSARYSGQAIVVEVVPQGSLPRTDPSKRRRRGFFFDDDPFDAIDPFDLLQKMPRRPFDDLLNPDAALQPLDVPEELVVEHPRDPIAFLRATAVPKRVVVGEQVVLRVYAYGARGPFDEVNTSEPSRADFLSQIIVENSYRQPRYEVPIDDVPWHAVKVREVALFPLRAGRLTIGPMRMGFRGRRYPAKTSQQGLVRYSDPIEIDVSEPPVPGRPPGYQLGDVGQFSLSATVEPRVARVGDAIKVVVSLTGTGNLPSTVILPQQKGIEWSEPAINTEDTVRGSDVGGTRQFSYVVQIEKPGTVNLGQVTLPYFDPEWKAYKVARANLGSLKVEPSPNAAVSRSEPNANEAQEASRLESVIAPRGHLGPPPRTPWRLTDHGTFWLLLAAGPLMVLSASGLARASRQMRNRLQQRRHEKATGPQAALREAERLHSSGDYSAMASAIERAVYAAVEQRVGLRGRGILRQELSRELSDRSVTSRFSEHIVCLLDDCDSLRFSTASSEDASDLLDRARIVVRWDEDRIGRA